MPREELLARLKTAVSDYMGTDEAKVTEEAKLEDDLGFDSADRIELFMGLEDEFNIEVPDDEVEKVATISDALNLIERKLA